MIRQARDAGALAPGLRRLAALLAWVGLAAHAHAAQVRLLHANPAAVRLEALPAGTDALAPTLQVQFEADGRIHEFTLRPNEQMGRLGQRLAGRAHAYIGQAGRYAGSWAALTRIGHRWSGIWYDGGEYYGVDTAGSLAGASIDAAMHAPESLMVYRLRDVQWEEMSHEGDTRTIPVTGADVAKQVTPMALGLPPGMQRLLEVGVVGDALLAEQDGQAMEANLLARLNVIDGVFTAQLGVRVAAGSVTLYTSHDDEPFGRTTNADHLLDELSAWRYTDSQQRESGLTHLFTGRNLNGRTVGMAFMDALCSRRYSTSLSQATSSVSFSALIAAHEIAHVFGAPHDGDADGACAATPTDYLMAPRINGSQQFSACSIEQMAPQVDLAACLATVRTDWPAEGPAPSTQGGGGTLPVWMPALLGMLAAARARRRLQMRANQSAR